MENADLLFSRGAPPRLVEEVFKKQYPATWHLNLLRLEFHRVPMSYQTKPSCPYSDILTWKCQLPNTANSLRHTETDGNIVKEKGLASPSE